MKYRNLGRTGLIVSRICLGTMTYGSPQWQKWVLNEEQSRPFYKKAIEAGINFFDTADIYSLGVSEEITGRALRDFAKRDEVVVATKVYNSMGNKPNMGGLSRVHIMRAIDNSLKRLNMDYIDLYQIHRWDDETPIEETMEALHDVVKMGKARYIGASSMYAWQFAKAQYIAKLNNWTPFVSMQNHYNLIFREEEREMIPMCIDQGVGLIPWSPLARGFLSGTRSRKQQDQTVREQNDPYAQRAYYQDCDFDVVDAVVSLAKEKAVSASQIALAWVLSRPGVTAPIVGMSKPEHFNQAIAALDIELSDEVVKRLESPYVPHENITMQVKGTIKQKKWTESA